MSEWAVWQVGLTICPSLPADPPPLRMRLALDNLAGYLTPAFVCWLFAQGILPRKLRSLPLQYGKRLTINAPITLVITKAKTSAGNPDS